MPDEVADEDVVSDPELITRVRAGDRAAFGELYRRHSGPATTLSRQFARSAAESDDLVSESFARVLDNLLSGKGPDTAFRAYLFTTIRNTAYDRTRKDKTAPVHRRHDDARRRRRRGRPGAGQDGKRPGRDGLRPAARSGGRRCSGTPRWRASPPPRSVRCWGWRRGPCRRWRFGPGRGCARRYLQAHLAETAAEQCRKTVESLGAWTRGGLSKREKAQVDAHLETCDRCRALAAELEEVNSGLRGLLAPLLLGGAAAGYLATLGPVAPLAAPGTLVAGAGASGAGGFRRGRQWHDRRRRRDRRCGRRRRHRWCRRGRCGRRFRRGDHRWPRSPAGAARGAAGAVGAAAYANAQAGSSAAGGAAAAGGTAAGGAAAAGTGAGGAAAGGLAGVVASMGVGGLVATGAAVLVAAVAAVVFVVSGNSPETTTAADQQDRAASRRRSRTFRRGQRRGHRPGAAGVRRVRRPRRPASAGGRPGTSDPRRPGTGHTAAGAARPGRRRDRRGVLAPDRRGFGGHRRCRGTADGPGAASTRSAERRTATSATGHISHRTPTSNQPDTSSTSTSPPVTPFNRDLGFHGSGAHRGRHRLGDGDDCQHRGSVAPSQPLTVTVPTGVQVTGVDVTPGGPALRRSALRLAASPLRTRRRPDLHQRPAGDRRSLQPGRHVSLSAEPTVVEGSVTIQIGTVNAQTIPISADSPIASLTLNTNAPLIAGTANTRTITVGTVNGVTDPGAITLTSGDANGTFGGSAGCVPPTGGSTITCTGTSIDVSIVIPNKLFAGPLPITITDAGGRQRSLALAVVTPADLQLSQLTISEPLIAGGGGQLALTVQQHRRQSVATEAIDISLPDGITVAGVTAGNTLICKGLGGACAARDRSRRVRVAGGRPARVPVRHRAPVPTGHRHHRRHHRRDRQHAADGRLRHRRIDHGPGRAVRCGKQEPAHRHPQLLGAHAGVAADLHADPARAHAMAGRLPFGQVERVAERSDQLGQLERLGRRRGGRGKSVHGLMVP